MTEPNSSDHRVALPPTKQLLGQAWAEVKGTKMSFFLLFFATIIWGSLVVLVADISGLIHWLFGHTALAILVFPAISALMAAFFLPGAVKMGVRRARGEELTKYSGFHYFRYYLPVALFFYCMIIFSMAVAQIVAFIALSVAAQLNSVVLAYGALFLAELIGLIVQMMLLLAIPLIVAGQGKVFHSMLLSMRIVKRNFSQLFNIVILLYLAMLLSMITAGIAFLWVIPFAFITTGHIYQHLVDNQTAT